MSLSRALYAMDTRIDLETLDRYIAGKASPRERVEVERWIAQNPLRSLDSLAKPSPFEPLLFGDSHARKERISERIGREPFGHGRALRRNSSARFSVGYRIVGIFSVLFLALGVGGYAVLGIPFPGNGDSSEMADASAVSEFATGVGQRMTIQLPDQSKVLLGPDTRIYISKSFGSEERVVELNGEALFTVTQSSGNPFIVRTSNSDTRVLGTSFSVRQYDSDSGAHIIVAEGKVSVSDRIFKSALVVSTGQQVQGANATQFQVIPVQNMNAALAWTQGRLDYSSAPVSQVIRDLQRMYGAEIRISSPVLYAQVITGSFEENMDVAAAAKLLTAMLGGKLETHGSTFLIMER